MFRSLYVSFLVLFADTFSFPFFFFPSFFFFLFLFGKVDNKVEAVWKAAESSYAEQASQYVKTLSSFLPSSMRPSVLGAGGGSEVCASLSSSPVPVSCLLTHPILFLFLFFVFVFEKVLEASFHRLVPSEGAAVRLVLCLAYKSGGAAAWEVRIRAKFILFFFN